MANKIDLTGQTFGCWKILNPAPNRIMGCGTVRTFWQIKCLNCGHIFEFLTKYLRRQLKWPDGCGKCKSKILGERKFKYGRNPNGFIDKNVLIEINNK